MVPNVTKISLKMENKSLLSIEKNYYKLRKDPFLKLQKTKKNDIESSFDKEYKDVLKL